jgi:ATP-dependent HslUV protease ATP-binding subunit HslU
MSPASQMTPAEIVSELDRHIVGQDRAKRAVAIALRNRWRRQQVAEPLRHEITPKNILMIGPTGVGKTEIARRLARLANAPFVKVEATKFTEVGYVGRDVDTIIRDLADIGVKLVREQAMRAVRSRALDAAEDRVLDILVPPPNRATAAAGPLGFLTEASDSSASSADSVRHDTRSEESVARQRFRKKLREGELDDREIEIDIAVAAPTLDVVGPPGMEQFSQQLQSVFQQMGSGRRKSRRLRIADALKQLTEEEAGRLINEDDVRTEALRSIEEQGIVFLDEIDKIATRDSHGPDVSRAGVQRDLLPLIEGTTVNTRHGLVKTDHILFIASGAFHLSKPSDLIPELQGRLPIRVEMASLSVEDFECILTTTDACLTRQYQALLATEAVALEFTAEGVRRLAEIAWQVNERTENIGARRLHTVMEKLLEDVSYSAGSRATGSSAPAPVVIDAAFVDERLAGLAASDDLARYVL